MSENTDKGGDLLYSPDLISLYSLTRSLDGIFWGLLFFYLTLIATFQDLVFASFPFLCCLPLFLISYSAYKIPIDFLSDPKWKKCLENLRTFSMIASFTFPFIIFMIKADRNDYFAICSIVAVYGAIRTVISLSGLSVQLGTYYDDKNLAKEGKLAVVLIYVSIMTAIAYVFTAVSNPALVGALLNSGTFGLIFKVGILIIIVFPLLLPLTLLFRLKTLIIFNTKEKLRKY